MNEENLILETIEAKPDDVFAVMSQPVGPEGRSAGHWMRTASGDLFLAFYPKGSTYFEVNEDCGI